MKMRNVMAAWIVIVMAMTTAAFAQRPEPARPTGTPPAFMGRTENCRVIIPNGARQNTFVCRCYMNPQGFNCMILPRATAMAMDSMREGRMDSMRGRMGRPGRMYGMRMNMDSTHMAHRDSMRHHMDTLLLDSLRARRQGRRP